ncbi:MAG: hypothetical protein ACTHL8_14935 [Burkholderiaceae bacterium]
MSRGRLPMLAGAVVALAGAASAAGVQVVAVTASAPAHATPRAPRPAKAPMPAANFLVEWRIQPVAAGRADDVVIASADAVRGTSGFGAGAVVVGTAHAAAAQSLRVANGREGSIRFDESQTHVVYDMSYAASASSESETDPSTMTAAASGASVSAGTGGSRSRSRSRAQEAQGHEVVVHRVDGLRVTPHWTRGDTLALDVQLTHARPAPGDGSAQSLGSRETEFSSTVELSFDEWQPVATVEDGTRELQLRVSWR